MVFFDDKEPIVIREWTGGSEYPPPNTIDVTFDFRLIDELEMLFGFAAKLAANSGFFVFSRRTYGGQHWRYGAAACSERGDHQ